MADRRYATVREEQEAIVEWNSMVDAADGRRGRTKTDIGRAATIEYLTRARANGLPSGDRLSPSRFAARRSGGRRG